MKSAKAMDESYFLSFAAIVSTINGTESSNSHIRDTRGVNTMVLSWLLLGIECSPNFTIMFFI